MSKIKYTYPEKVSKAAIEIFDAIGEDIAKDTQKTVEWIKDISIDIISKNLLAKFLVGDELLYTEDEFLIMINQIYTDLSVQGLKEKGLIDTIDDKDGEEIIFLTKKGKDYND